MDNIKQEDIEDICFNVSRNIILPKFKNLSDDDINYKNGSDLVTAADIEAEKELKKNLLKILPTSNFIGEEEYSRNENILNFYNEDAYCWTVDPIDGTTNFANGRDKFAIMIALTFKEKILASVQPLTIIYKSPIQNDPGFYSFWREEDTIFENIKKIIKKVRQGRVRLVFHKPIEFKTFGDRKHLSYACYKAVRNGLVSPENSF